MIDLLIDIPDSFFQEETRCGHVVSQDMKKIWAVELDLLAEFERVCKKYNLTYMAVGGTLLGAARHKGFIPWDDDIDLAMFRDDYEKLITIGSKEFKHPYFLQTAAVSIEERPFLSDMIRLRNSETTAVISMQHKYSPNANQGIFIDIFPLDNTLADKFFRDRQLKRIKRFYSLNKFFYFCTKDHLWHHPNKFISLSRKIIAFLFNKPMKIMANRFFAKYIHECKKYNGQATSNIGILMFVTDAEKLIYESDDCRRTVDVEFEFRTIPIGIGYDRMLTHQYGDWHKMVKGTAYHYLDLMSADIPFSQYLNLKK